MPSNDPTPPISVFPQRATQVEPGFSRYEALVDPKQLRDTYLFGIPLKSNLTGQELEDSDLQSFIIRAISVVEHELRIHISPVVVTEPHNYNLWDYTQFNFMALHQWPIIQVIAIRGKFPNTQEFMLFPMEWYTVDPESGYVRLAPTNGSITQFFLTNEAAYLPLILGSRTYWPHLWEVEYLTGFDNDKIPAAVNHLIGTGAALMVLELLGSVMFPYAGYSIGIDGASQSVSTPGPQFFQARIANMREDYQRLLKTLKDYYGKTIILEAF